MERHIQLAVIRILASMIDLIVVYLPFQILCFFIFKDHLNWQKSIAIRMAK